MNIHLDLHEQATRGQILDTLLENMTAEERATFDAVLDGATIPDMHHHSIVEVNQTIDTPDVPDQVKTDLRGVYDILAHAEAKVHGCPVEETHFHEVGNPSGIRNALAICAAFYALHPETVSASAIQTGEGEVECAHGVLPLPAPATAAILEGLPLEEKRLPGERCTPTSAAIIKYFVQSFEV